MSNGLTKIDSVAGVTIYSVSGEPKSIVCEMIAGNQALAKQKGT
jgi:hypothetical protein